MFMCLSDDDIDAAVLRPASVPLVVAHLFDCDLCYQRQEETVEFIRALRLTVGAVIGGHEGDGCAVK
jgi:hypothetical protein